MSPRSKPRKGAKVPGAPRPDSPAEDRSASGNVDAGRRGSKRVLRKRTNGSANGAGTTSAELLAAALREARRTPEVRAELVARYKRLISEGRYHPDPQKIAERMIRKGLLKDL